MQVVFSTNKQYSPFSFAFRNMIVILLFVLHVETASSLSGEHQNCEPLLEPLAIAYKLHNGMFEILIFTETLKYYSEMK